MTHGRSDYSVAQESSIYIHDGVPLGYIGHVRKFLTMIIFFDQLVGSFKRSSNIE